MVSVIIERVQEIGDGGSGGKRACLSLRRNSELITGGLGRFRDWKQKFRLV